MYYINVRIMLVSSYVLICFDRRMSRCEHVRPLKSELVADTRCRWSNDGKRTCYKLVHQQLSWSKGRVYCKSLADEADLVSVETKAENDFLLDMIKGDVASTLIRFIFD